MGFALAQLSDEQRGERLRRRFMAKVTVLPDGCWRFTGALDPKGYGRFHHAGTGRLAHRVAYEILVGPVPDGLTLDHTCHGAAVAVCPGGAACVHRSCVNPAHLEPVPQRENVVRGSIVQRPLPTHCTHGHPYDDANTYRGRSHTDRPHLICRACIRAAGARYRERKRLETYSATLAGTAA